MNKKIGLIIIILLSCMLSNVKAVENDSFYNENYIEHVYFIKDIPGEMKRYETARFIKRRSDGMFTYCLEPFKEFGPNKIQTAYNSDYEKVTNLTTEQWNRIRLLAYYGYQYNNHYHQKWYAITQLLIWQTVDPYTEMYFSNSTTGVKVPMFDQEINELETLVANHNKKPSFDGSNQTMSIGSTITLTDSNNVLYEYIADNNSNITINKNGPNLKITANKLGKTTLKLMKNNSIYPEPPIVYTDPVSQNLLVVGSYDPVVSNININVVGGQIKLTKIDSETNSTNSQGEASLIGSVYNVFDSNNNIVSRLTIGNDKTTFTEILPYGDYTIREVISSPGYYLNATTYKVTINSTIPVNVNVKGNVIKGNIKMTRLDKETNKCILQGEASLIGAEYGIYDNKNNLVDKIIINENCEATTKLLPYGNYKIKEVSSSLGYKQDTNIYTANITNDKTINITSKVEVIKGNIKITRLDKETNSCIPQGEASLMESEYGIYDNKNNLVDRVTINKDCKATTKLLPYGNYKIKGITSSLGYKQDTNIYTANITNDKTINITSKVEVIKGNIKITRLDKETNKCIPQGEASLIGAEYGIYDNKNNLIDKVTINEDCEATTKLLPYGNYKIKEIKNSIGYYLNENIYSEYILKEELYDVVILGDVIKNIFDFYKFYGNEETGFIYAEPNALFEIYNNNKLMSSFITDKNGQAEITLPYGSYIVKQKSGLDDYKLIYPFNINVTEDTDKIQINYIKNGSMSAKLKLINIDSENRNNIRGAKFRIKNSKTNEYICQTTNEVICEYETNEEGILITPLPLFEGSYIIEQVLSSKGYLLSEKTIEFNIKDNMEIIEDSIYGSIIEVIYENNSIKGNLEINLIGEDFKNNSYIEIPLKNAVYELYDENKNLIKTISTDEKGGIIIENLKLGIYYLKQLKTSNNNIIDEKEYKIELDTIKQNIPVIIKKINLKNFYSKASLEIKVIDKIKQNPLSNARLEIYLDDNILIGSYLTNKNGKIFINNLPTNKNMYIFEKDVPENYKLNENKLNFILKDNKLLQINIEKEKMDNIKENLPVDQENQNSDFEEFDDKIEDYESEEEMIKNPNNEHKKKEEDIFESSKSEELNESSNVDYDNIEEDAGMFDNSYEVIDVPDTGIKQNNMAYILGMILIMIRRCIKKYEKTT